MLSRTEIICFPNAGCYWLVACAAPFKSAMLAGLSERRAGSLTWAAVAPEYALRDSSTSEAFVFCDLDKIQESFYPDASPAGDSLGLRQTLFSEE